jgi:hypothetical protein
VHSIIEQLAHVHCMILQSESDLVNMVVGMREYSLENKHEKGIGIECGAYTHLNWQRAQQVHHYGVCNSYQGQGSTSHLAKDSSVEAVMNQL